MIADQAAPSPAPAMTTADAEASMRRLMQAMERLLAMVGEETALVRAGRLRDAAAVQGEKGDFARGYAVDMHRLAGNKAALAGIDPELAASFRESHARFGQLLRTNMTVLATAHAVSEDLIRGVSGELARKAAPQTYGATGRPNALGPSAMQPLAVSRSL
jgi:hypothetical protein